MDESSALSPGSDQEQSDSNLTSMSMSMQSTFDIFSAARAAEKKPKKKRVSKGLVKRLKKVKDKAARLVRSTQALDAVDISCGGAPPSLASLSGARIVARGFLDLDVVTQPGVQVRRCLICGRDKRPKNMIARRLN